MVERAGLAGCPSATPPEETGPIWERVERASPEREGEIVIHEVFGRLYTGRRSPGNAHRGGNLAPGLIVGESGELCRRWPPSYMACPGAGGRDARPGDQFHALLRGALDDLREELALPQDSAPKALPVPELSFAPPSFYAGGPLDAPLSTPEQPTRLCPTVCPTTRARSPTSLGTAIPQMDFSPISSALRRCARWTCPRGSCSRWECIAPLPSSACPRPTCTWSNGSTSRPCPPHCRRRLPRRLGHHAGHAGSGYSARRLPVFADQPQNADRVDALERDCSHGGPVAAPTSRRALSTLLSEPSNRAAAASWQPRSRPFRRWTRRLGC